MSTNAESAQSWLDEQARSDEQLQQMIDKLYERIEKFQDQPDVDLSGSEAAVRVLEIEQEKRMLVVPEPTTTASALDLGDLGHASADIAAAPKDDDEKRARFESLKAQIKTL